MIRKLSVSTKLMIPTLLLCIVSGSLGVVGYSALQQVSGGYRNVTDRVYPELVRAEQMALAYRQIRIEVRTLGLPGLNKEQADSAVKGVLKNIGEYEALAKEFETGLEGASEQEKAIYAKVKTSWATFKSVGEKLLNLWSAGSPEDKAKMVEIFLKDCPEAAHEFSVAMGELTAHVEHKKADTVGAAESVLSGALRLILLTVSIGLTLGFIAAYFVARSTGGLVSAITRVAENLGHEVDSVSQVAEQVSDASRTLSSTSIEQASAIQQTTSAMEQTSAMVGKNAENSMRSQSISEQSQDTAQRGKTAVSEMLESIDQISRANADIAVQIDESNAEMNEVVKLIEEIGTKTKVINDIVFQTKLLSFNASVEAARAGEQGKGFAVVAEEVGNLAQMSGNSAKEISDLLEVSTSRVRAMAEKTKVKVDALVKDCSEKMARGNEVARRCDQVLDQIVTGVQDVGGLVAEISTASQEQARGVAEANKAVSELDRAAQQNSQASTQVSTGATALSEQVNSLRELIVGLNGLVGRQNSEPVSETTSKSERPLTAGHSREVPLRKAA